jgi:hypothetical protein
VFGKVGDQELVLFVKGSGFPPLGPRALITWMTPRSSSLLVTMGIQRIDRVLKSFILSKLELNPKGEDLGIL